MRAIHIGKMRLVGRQITLRKNRMLRANIRAVPAVNAFIRINEDMRYGPGIRIARQWRNRGGGALGRANKILGAGIRYYISHKISTLCSWGVCINQRPLLSLNSLRSQPP